MNSENLTKEMKKTLPLRVKFGYGIGAATDSTSADYVASFLLFFLTTMAGVSPAVAGGIIGLAVFWDAITDPIIGNLSDRTKSKMGRRRPWLAFCIVPFMLAQWMLFTPVEFSEAGKNAYFIIAAIAYYTLYTCVMVPYYSLGASIVSDYNDRTMTRVISQMLNYIGVFLGTAAPPLIVASLIDSGMAEGDAWSLTTKFVSGAGLVFILIAVISTRGRDEVPETEAGIEKRKTHIFKDMWEILRIKTFVILTAASLLYRTAIALVVASTIFYVIYVAKLDLAALGAFYTTMTFAGFACVFILVPIVKKFDKKYVVMFALGFSGLAVIGFTWVGISSAFMLIVYMLLYSPGSGSYWAINYALIYDIAEIDEFKNGKRREGTILAFALFTNKLGYAIATAISGILLEVAGFNADVEVQTAEAVTQINYMFTLYPGLLMLLAVLLYGINPMNKKKYEKLQAQLELKRSGKEYNTDGFEKLL